MKIRWWQKRRQAARDLVVIELASHGESWCPEQRLQEVSGLGRRRLSRALIGLSEDRLVESSWLALPPTGPAPRRAWRMHPRILAVARKVMLQFAAEARRIGADNVEIDLVEAGLTGSTPDRHRQHVSRQPRPDRSP